MSATASTVTRNRQATPERWQRALQRAKLAGVQVRQLQGSGQWVVTSGSDPNAAYETDGTTCTCPAAQLGGDPVCLHRAAYWQHQGVLDFDGAPASPAPSQPADRLIELFRGELDYLAGALAYIAALDHDDRLAA